MNKLCVLSILLAIGILAFWKNPSVNFQTKLTIHDSIYQNTYKTYDLKSMENQFSVSWIEHASLEAINPYFPAIHLATQAPHNAWVHLVYLDNKFAFIDATQDNYPFYTYDTDFYDAPHWNYTLLKKPLNFWQGHAYAVQLDQDQKIINCVGGVAWGFELGFFKTKPKALPIKALSVSDWQQDLAILNSSNPLNEPSHFYD